MLQGWMERQCLKELHHTMATVATLLKIIKRPILTAKNQVYERGTVSLVFIYRMVQDCN